MNETDPTQAAKYCRTCWYVLIGLEKPRCPECGRAFDPANPRTYRTKPRRTWWLSVLRRCALGLLLILAISGGWLGWHYLAQRQATTTLDALGLRYDSQPVGPAWLTRLARRGGLPVPARITNVRPQPPGFAPADTTYPGALKTLTWLSLQGDSVSDADLIQLRKVPALKTLNLNSPTVTDAGLVYLESLEQLESLSLVNTPVTDDGLRLVSKLKSLKTLLLAETHTTAKGLVHLQPLVNLEFIGLQAAQLTPEGLAFLEKLPKLRSLSISGPSLSDKTVALLRSLPKLTRVSLRTPRKGGDKPGLTDAGLEPLAAMTQLEHLTISSPHVTDDGLRHLADLTRLEWLGLDGTAVSGTGFKHLEALANLKNVTLIQAPVTDAGLARITALASIEMLRLGFHGRAPESRLTDKGLIHLRKLPQLQLVSLRGLPITRAAIDDLKTARPNLVVDGP